MRVNYRDIGKRVRYARIQQGISQEKLAEKVGVGTTHISHIETGNTTPSLKTFISILNVLEISADELLCNHLYKSECVFEDKIAEIMKDCSSDEMRIICDVIESLKKSLRVRNNYKELIS